MKKIIFLLVAFPFLINAQISSICDCNIEYGLQPYHSTGTEIDFSNEPPLVMNISFQLNENTAIDEGLTESDYLEAVALLNINYNQYNIFFKYLGFEFVDAEFLFDFAPYYQPDRINFIILGGEGGGVAGIPNPLNAATSFQAITNEEDKKFLILHEVGHVLGLAHVNGGTANNTSVFMSPLNCNSDQLTEGTFPSFSPLHNENVTRDPSNPNYNANEAGDFVVDTGASYFEPNLCIDMSSGTPTLQYLVSNEVVDAVDEPYDDVAVNNLMTSVGIDREEFHHFFTVFTDGQAIRMRETIINETVLQAATTTVASLYEPYTGNYYFAGPSNPDDKPLFQPGFDYKFVSAGGQTPSGYEVYNTPSAYEDISFTYDNNVVLDEIDRFSLDLDNITHPNRSAIVIEQLEDQPRKCYHNVNRGASNGKIIKFNDNIFNHNYTITEQDSLHINQPTLIQDLENGLYIIEKNYDDGTQEQSTILKGNNND